MTGSPSLLHRSSAIGPPVFHRGHPADTRKTPSGAASASRLGASSRRVVPARRESNLTTRPRLPGAYPDPASPRPHGLRRTRREPQTLELRRRGVRTGADLDAPRTRRKAVRSRKARRPVRGPRRGSVPASESVRRSRRSLPRRASPPPGPGRATTTSTRRSATGNPSNSRRAFDGGAENLDQPRRSRAVGGAREALRCGPRMAAPADSGVPRLRPDLAKVAAQAGVPTSRPGAPPDDGGANLLDRDEARASQPARPSLRPTTSSSSASVPEQVERICGPDSLRPGLPAARRPLEPDRESPTTGARLRVEEPLPAATEPPRRTSSPPAVTGAVRPAAASRPADRSPVPARPAAGSRRGRLRYTRRSRSRRFRPVAAGDHP